MTGDTMARPSAGYLFTFAIGTVVLPLLGIGLRGLLLVRAGRDPFGAWNAIGMPCFIAGFAMSFAMRLIFWRRTSEAARRFMRTGFTLIFSLLTLASVASVVLLAITSAAVPVWITIFILAAVLCQAGGVAWLVRYRKEGA